MKPLHIALIVCGGLLLLFILFIIFIRLSNKKRFNRLQENLKKIEQEKEEFDNDKRINFEDIFAEIDEKPLTHEAVVEDYIPEEPRPKQEENQTQNFDEILNIADDKKQKQEAEYRRVRQKRDKEFNKFLDEHAYSRKILDKNLLDKLKKLPPELKLTILNSVFEKFDDK